MLIDLSHILKIPPVWPDEALNADTALNILNHHPAGTELLNITLPGAKEFGFGYPPLFFYLLAIWFRIFGFSIFTQRILTVIISAVFLLILYLLLRLLCKSKTLPFLAVALLLSDISFFKASIISRPEIVVLLFGTLSIYILLKSEELKSKKKIIFYAISGLSIGVGFLFHYLEVIFMVSLSTFLLIKYKFKLLKQSTFLIFLMSFLLPIILWLIIIGNNLNYLINDLSLRYKYGANEIIWVRTVFAGNDFSIKIVYIIYLLILLGVINSFFTTKTMAIKLLAILLTFSWIFTYLWHTEYAFICVILASYIAFVSLIYENYKNPTKKKIYLAIFLILISLNVYNLGRQILNVSGEKYSYSRFVKSILSNVPDKKSVYLSSIPDAYFAFRPNRENTLYEFPFLPTSKQLLIKVLNDSDYIIYNSSLEKLVTGDTVLEYMQKNQEEIIKIGAQDQYSALVIKLRPKNHRL